MTHPVKAHGKNLLEWSVFVSSLALIAATLVVLATQAGKMGDRPASLDLKLGVPLDQGDWTRVPVTVINRGGRAAANVEVAVSAASRTEGPRATCTFDFVPRSGKREGSVLFRTQAFQQPNLEASVIGFTDP